MSASEPRFSTDAGSLRAAFGLDGTVLDEVRAVGALLAARVPQMLEAFYGWLSGLPEYPQFFTDGRLLAQVKAQQVQYWEDFLRAEVDDGYVHRRRIVGQTHARIELGLLIYLQAMEFVSRWFRRQVEASEELRLLPTAVFSVRKLIEFDSAIVVDTYGRLTARRLDDQRVRLEQVATVMRAVAEGDLQHRIQAQGPADILGSSLNEMVDSLRRIAQEMGAIARGEFSGQFIARGPRDQLGVALQAMTLALRQSAQRNEELIWVANVQTQVREAMGGNPSVQELSRRVLSELCRALKAHVGTKYVLEGDQLRLVATYATASGDGVRERWLLGEGLVGQAAEEKRRILVTDVPKDSLRIRFSTGEAIPGNVVVFPVLHEGEVHGVIELGVLNSFAAHELDLLDRVSPSIGLAVSAAVARAQAQQLLEESQAQSEELTAQQEELRQVNDVLAEQARALESQKENLVATEAILRQQAVELERASRYKSEFLANMSHELRTPLNSSLILSKLLMENRNGNLSAEQVSYAHTIYSAGNDLLALINDILDLSKIEAGKVELTIEAVSVAEILEGLRSRFEPLASEKSLQLVLEVDARCPTHVFTDKQRLRQILVNLLSNAVKFTEHGSIRIAARARGAEQVQLSVIDTGIGISAEQHETIFEAFQQADGTINRRYGGTGLGLSISRELAALLGGSIELTSSLGEGSAFTVVLPLRAAPQERSEQRLERERSAPVWTPPETSPVRKPGSSGPAAGDTPGDLQWIIEDDRAAPGSRRRGVLVIEDDPGFAAILRDLARELGFQCVVAGGAEAGLRLARERAPVAVILDIGLPDHSGLAVLELLKRDPATRHVPIHVISVHDYQQVAREMGAVGYMLKPVKREQLVAAFEALEKHLSRRARSVLVVEDDAVQRDAIVGLLSTEGVTLIGVGDADAALAQLRSDSFDCVVLDLMLPGISGFDLLERIGRDSAYSSPPVIVYTARMLTQDEERRLRQVSRSIIVKGARSPERLLEEVTLFLHQVEAELPEDKQRLLKLARSREAVFEGRRILLVEDDVRNVFALTSLLEPKGAAVDIARNGREAIERLRAGPAVDLVLMDVMMPVMDGLAATREIRKHDHWKALPIIALTAKAMPDDRHDCVAAGANDYIAKPVDPEKLLSLIRVWMPR